MFQQSEQMSKDEIEAGEAQATMQVQIFSAACVALWFTPHVLEWAYKLF